jgi:hypothetical protein
MALQHKLSDAISIKIEENENSSKSIEIEFKYIRYKLLLDDFEKTEELIKLLNELRMEPINRVDEPKMPKFYKETRPNEI